MNVGTNRFLIFLLVLGCMCACLCGCAGSKNKDGNTQIVLTTGFEEDEIFRIGESSCNLSEIMVYLTNMQNQYESVYGSQIWDRMIGDETLKKKVKDVALDRLAQIKTMNLLAEREGIELTQQEEEEVQRAATEYFSSLNEVEISSMGIDESTVEKLYYEYALANKVYNYIIEEINPEISDDEARTVTVSQIFVKTYALDGTGTKVPYTEESKALAYEKIREIKKMLREGADFDELATRYSEDGQFTFSFRKGEAESAYEEVAFNLGNGEISDIIETESGYYIIKCVSTLDREQTDQNKIKIIEERKEEVFAQVYDEFVLTQIRNLNDELWEQVEFIHEEECTTTTFFDVYNRHFESQL
nr:peptidylprolyl isomerase [Lachnospiraceae bacterium]